MRLLFLLNSMRVSGTEKLMISLSKIFNENSHEVYLFPLISPFDKNFIETAEVDRGNIIFPTIILRLDKFFWMLNGLTTSLFNWSSRSFILRQYLSHQCKKLKIDLIVSNSYTTDAFVYPLCKKINLKYVIIDHGSYVSYIVNKTNFDTAFVEKAAAMIAVSTWTYAILKAKFPELPIKLVYNGYINPPRGPVSSALKQQFSSPEYFVFCMHGRGTIQKGWDTSIGAFYLLKEKGYRVKLLILSESEYIDSLKKQNEHEKDIIFGGFCYNLMDIFAYVDAGLLLSREYEAFGLSILDYFNAGIPVVASNLGGIPEVVHCQNLRGGLLVDVDEHGTPPIQETFLKMEELMLNKFQYYIFSGDSKIIARHFSIEKCYEAYNDLFSKVINGEKR